MLTLTEQDQNEFNVAYNELGASLISRVNVQLAHEIGLAVLTLIFTKNRTPKNPSRSMQMKFEGDIELMISAIVKATEELPAQESNHLIALAHKTVGFIAKGIARNEYLVQTTFLEDVV
jgi:hypothetical protein